MAEMDDRDSGRHAPFRSAVGRSLGRWIGIAVALLAFGVVLLPRLGGWLGDLGNPFTTRSVDRSQPALLKALENLSEYRAASGTFEVIVDVEKDAKFVPSAIRGQRVVLIAHGTVDAGVDLGKLDDRTVSLVDKRVYITLPHATLSPARLDLAKTRIFERNRGLLDRLGDALGDGTGDDSGMYTLAEQKLAAAAAESDLLTRAEENTTTMLRNLMRPLGFEEVTVTFADPAVTTTTAVEAADPAAA